MISMPRSVPAALVLAMALASAGLMKKTAGWTLSASAALTASRERMPWFPRSRRETWACDIFMAFPRAVPDMPLAQRTSRIFPPMVDGSGFLLSAIASAFPGIGPRCRIMDHSRLPFKSF